MINHIFVFILIFFSFFANAVDVKKCEIFTKSFIDYTQKNVSLLQKREYIGQNIDTKFITKYVLGSNWRTLTPDERKQFYDVYSKYVVYKYATYFNQYKIDSYKISSSLQNNKRPEICDVTALIQTKIQDKPVEMPLVGVISDIDGKLLMQDIVYKNLSILQLQQQEISGLIKAEGYQKTLIKLQDFIETQKK
jgi:ABC-type transporter MlaC component